MPRRGALRIKTVNAATRTRRVGFTLLELLLVTVILGVLTTLAIPQYLKTIERARMTEATIMLGQLRSAQIRYRAQAGRYSNRLASLDFNPLDVSGKPVFEYLDPVTDPLGMVFEVRARRKRPGDGAPRLGTGCLENYLIKMDQDGNLLGMDCQITD